jgi:Flp pilus assembly protein TadG
MNNTLPNPFTRPHPHRLRRQLYRRPSGQGLVEFVLVSVIVLILTMGLADIGRMYYTFLALQTAAGEGVSYAQVYPSCATSAHCTNPDNVTYRVQNSAPRAGLVDWTNTTVSVDAPHGSDAGQPIDVTVNYEYRLIAPFMNVIIGDDSFEMHARASAVILR